MYQSDLFATVEHSAQLDPEAEAFCLSTSTKLRRAHGITFTPPWLVESMLKRCAAIGPFDTIVDAGAGTGRFALAAARHFPRASVVAVELNQDLAQALRGKVSAAGLGTRIRVVNADYRAFQLEFAGRTLFVGNPPYVRHHDIEEAWKRWYRDGMIACGIKASQLAGLHAHFLLRSTQLMRAGDALSFVTAAEWMDNGYGSALRQLLTAASVCRLRSLWLAPADEPVFPDALVSAVVIEAGCSDDRGGVQLGRLLGRENVATRCVETERLHTSSQWSMLCQPGDVLPVQGVQLGELFRVTRGQVTGMNEAWVLPVESHDELRGLGVPAVTRAREIIDGTAAADDARQRLRYVVDLPADIDQLAGAQRDMAARIIERARRLGADRSYVAQQRKPWFAVGMREPPAAFVSYMGRRPPVFRANPQRVSFLNIAHGLYPRQPIAGTDLQRMLDHLNMHTALYSGRVYGGGMAKFEPSDVARLRLPAAVWNTTP
jgi:SAM-dependent methyltransferase